MLSTTMISLWVTSWSIMSANMIEIIGWSSAIKIVGLSVSEPMSACPVFSFVIKALYCENLEPCLRVCLCHQPFTASLYGGLNFWHQFLRHFFTFQQKLMALVQVQRSEEHTSELQSLMRISYAVFCLKKKKL